MTSKFSRAALIAGLAVGASGLVVVPAQAANGISTANYYVNNPAVAGAADITPESAVVSASVDTGGNPESLVPVSASGLTWSAVANITATAEKWNDGTAAVTTSGSYAPVDGIPVSGANSNVSVTVTDSGDPAISGVPTAVSNAGNDNYSDVTFEYDPISDYVSNGGTPGPETSFAQDVQVPTSAGLSSVSTTIGAFGQAAQNNTGNTPLTPGTKYYYWIVQQAGATDAATNVNISKWASVTSGTPAAPANNSYKCYPNVAIALDPTLASYTSSTQITYGGATLPALQGPCIYYFGNTGGALYYQSPNGTFTTPKLGKLVIAHRLMAANANMWLAIKNTSVYKASGSVELTTKGGAKLGSAKFALVASGKASVKVTLTAKGRKALKHHAWAELVLTSNWDQTSSTKSVKL